MAEFKQLIITDRGQALMAKMLAGAGNVQFTKISVSDTTYTDEQLSTLTSLSGVKQSTLISKVIRTNDVAVQVEGAITNSELTSGYYMKTIALYALDPDDGEILYAVTNASVAGYMPPFNGVTTSGAFFKLVTTVSNASNVSLNVDPAAVATIDQLKNVENTLNVHIGNSVYSESGVHGFRYHNDRIQFNDNEGNWIDIDTGGENPISFGEKYFFKDINHGTNIYRNSVILLTKKYVSGSGVLNHKEYLCGKFSIMRGASSSSATMFNFFIELNTSYNGTLITLNGHENIGLYNARIVTCTYLGQQYLALDLSVASYPTEIFFEGLVKSDGRVFDFIEYYDNYNDVVINSEINDSVQEYTSFLPRLNYGHLLPCNDNLFDFGRPDLRWDDIYATNGTIQTSDKNDKENIEPLDSFKSLEFLKALNPVKFNFKQKTRPHWGLIAQDVEEVINSLGFDFAGFTKTPIENIKYDKDGNENLREIVDYKYGLRYQEFISLLIKVVQVQEQRIEAVEKKINV